jgi:ribonuclease III
MTDALADLLEQVGYIFQDPELLVQALTHRSYAHECGPDAVQHNERLEFLGDAVVNLSVAGQIMERLPEAREGQLTKLRAMVVSEPSLADAARSLSIGVHLRLGRGEENTGGREKPSILADVFEALMGAIFLDGGFAVADRAVRRLLGRIIDTAVEGDLDRDHKGRLQELVQGHGQPTPRYEVVEERGPDHAKVFVVAVFLGEGEIARAEGPAKKIAERRAARLALDRLEAAPPELLEDSSRGA